MSSRFEETLRRAREEGEAKLKIIAPKYKVPEGSSYGRPGGGGSGRRSVSETRAMERAREEEYRRIAEEARQTKEIAKQKAAIEAQIAAAKTQAQKTAIARNFIEQQKATNAYRNIIAYRSNLIKAGARENVSTSKDYKSGDELRITTWKQNGNRVVRNENLTTGLVTYNQYSVPKGGGGARFAGGVSSQGEPKKEKVVGTINTNLGVTNIKNFTDTTMRRDGTSSAINNVQGTRNINLTLNRDINMSKPSQFIMDVADILSGGFFTEIKIAKEQEQLNNRVVSFNKKYDGQELTEAQYQRAIAEENYIRNQQSGIDKKYDNLVNSKKNKVRNFYQSLSVQKTPRLTTAQQAEVVKARATNIKIQADIRKNQPQIKKRESQVKNNQQKIAELKAKPNRTLLDEVAIIRLNNQINNYRNDIAVLNHEMPPRILMGTMPIIPANILPSGITKIQFLGKQKAVGANKIISTIVFKTNRGSMGIAKGVTIVKGKNSISIIGGRFGKVVAKLRNAGRKFIKIKSFVGVEKGTSQSTTFTSKILRAIAKFQSDTKKSGVIQAIKQNIKGMQQAGIGRVTTVSGKQFFRPFIRFPSGSTGLRMAKGMSIDDFASVSAILTKGDLSAIIGKTITTKGAKAEFIGLIKSLASGSSRVVLTSVDKQQFSRALQKLFSTVAAAVARAERNSTLTTRAMVYAGAALYLSRTTPTVAALKSARTTTVTKKIVSGGGTVMAKQSQRVKSFQVSKMSRAQSLRRRKAITVKKKQLELVISRSQTKIKQLSRRKNRSRAAQRQLSLTKQAQKLAQKQLSVLKQAQKQMTKTISVVGIPRMIGVKIPPFIKLKGGKGFSVRTLSKAQPTFYIKVKHKGKLVNLNPRPLTLRDSKDFLAYHLDNNLVRSGYFEPMGKLKRVVTIPKKMKGYFGRYSKKLRGYKIKVGKKKKIRSGYIEKRKYFNDRPLEKAQSKRLRAKAKRGIPKRKSGAKRGIPRRTAPKRKPMSASRRKQLKRARAKRGGNNRPPTRRTIVRRAPARRSTTIKRKISPQRRRQLIKQLKRARAVRMRNLRRR